MQATASIYERAIADRKSRATLRIDSRGYFFGQGFLVLAFLFSEEQVRSFDLISVGDAVYELPAQALNTLLIRAEARRAPEGHQA